MQSVIWNGNAQQELRDTEHKMKRTHKIQNWSQGSVFGTENKASWFNSQHMRQTVLFLWSVQTSSQVRTVEKRSKGIQGKGH